MEIWLPIQGYEGSYEVSNMGRVRSVERYIKVTRGGRRTVAFFKGRILKTHLNRTGEECTSISEAGRKTYIRMHRIVALHFIPNPDNLPEVNHLNFKRYDNRVVNLEWSTSKANVDHAQANGRYAHKTGKIDLEAFRLLTLEGATRRELALWFSMSEGNVSKIFRMLKIPDRRLRFPSVGAI